MGVVVAARSVVSAIWARKGIVWSPDSVEKLQDGIAADKVMTP